MKLKVEVDERLAHNLPRASTGLLLGVRTPAPRVLQWVSTPPPPPMAAPRAWAVQHARLLSLSCVGGVHVLGTFTALTQTPTPAQLQLAVAVARDVVGEGAVVLHGGARANFGAKEVLSEGERSAVVNELALAPRVVLVRGVVRLPHVSVLVHETSSQKQAETLCAAVMQHRFEHAVVTLGQQRVVFTQGHDVQQPSLADVMQWQPAPSSSKKKSAAFVPREPLDATVFVPLHVADPPLVPPRSASCAMHMSGSMHFEALVMQDASIGTVLHAVRQDLCNSIRARLQMLHDADDDDQQEQDEQQQKAQPEDTPATPVPRALPSRVMATPLSSELPFIPFCDYLMHGENVEDDVTDRLADVLSWDHARLEKVRIHPVEQPLSLNTTVKRVTFDEPPQQHDPNPMSALDAAGKAPSAVLSTGILAAVIIAIVAIILKEIIWVYF